MNSSLSATGYFDKKKIYGLVSFLLVLLLVLFNIKRIGKRMVNEIKVFNQANFQVFDSDEIKIRTKLDWRVLDYYEFIKRNTPEDAKILIPPQAHPWPMTGNAAYSRYFLYPRYLISGDEYTPGLDLKKEGIRYVLINWGETGALQRNYTHGWPKFSVPSRRIIYKKPTNEKFNYDKIIVDNQDYNPSQIKPDLWGLVEVDLERL